MTAGGAWPSPADRVVGASFRLRSVPAEPARYREGAVADPGELAALHACLEPLAAHPAVDAFVAYGELRVRLASGGEVVLQPWFDQARDEYRATMRSGNRQYALPPELAALLRRWRGAGSPPR